MNRSVRPLPVILGVVLGLAAAAVVLPMFAGRGGTPGLNAGPLLSDCDGQIRDLVIRYVPESADITADVYCDLLQHLPTGVTVHVVGAALILSGVLVSSGHKPPPGTTRRQLVAGVLIGALAMASMAYGIVIAKPALDGFPLVWAALIRLLAGTAALAGVALLSPTRRKLWSVFRPSADWKTALPGALVGTYLAYMFWLAGFKYAEASINAILNQTNVIFAIILATVIVKEQMTRRKVVSVALAVVGVVITVLHEEVGGLVQRLPWH